MLTIIIGILLMLHGLVHLLYAGQSGRLFELRPNMSWPDGSWAFSRLLGDETTRLLVGVSLVLAALGYMVGGLGLFIKQDWWRTAAACSALFSTAIFLLSWDGNLQALPDKGGVGILINLVILGVVFLVK
jgi:hypothetical protein